MKEWLKDELDYWSESIVILLFILFVFVVCVWSLMLTHVIIFYAYTPNIVEWGVVLIFIVLVLFGGSKE